MWCMIRQVSLVAASPLTAGLHVSPTAPQARVLQAGIHTLHLARVCVADNTHSAPALTSCSTLPHCHHNDRWRTKWERNYSSWTQQLSTAVQHKAPIFTCVVGGVGSSHPKMMSSGRDTGSPSVCRTQTGEDSSRGMIEEEGEEVDFEALVEMEVELSRQEGQRIPSFFTPTQWQELLTKKSFSARRKYMTFLFKTEMKSLNDKRKKEERRQKMKERWEERERNKDTEGNDHIEYGLWNNSIFLRIRDQKMVQFYHTRCIHSMMFGQPLVFDLGFDKHMRSVERQNCAYQLQVLMSENRSHKDPYHLHLCNAPVSSDTLTRLNRFIPPLLQPEYPVTVSGGSYLETYPREQLVYLTPHCRQEMTHYDHDAVYIIGGIVDKMNGEPLTLAKAKREGIRMQKLPLDRYLEWGSGSGKSLTLIHMIQILLDLKTTGDWNHALRHVPRRKLRTGTMQEELEKRMQRKMKLSHTSNTKIKMYRSGV